MAVTIGVPLYACGVAGRYHFLQVWLMDDSSMGSTMEFMIIIPFTESQYFEVPAYDEKNGRFGLKAAFPQ